MYNGGTGGLSLDPHPCNASSSIRHLIPMHIITPLFFSIFFLFHTPQFKYPHASAENEINWCNVCVCCTGLLVYIRQFIRSSGGSTSAATTPTGAVISYLSSSSSSQLTSKLGNKFVSSRFLWPKK